MTIIEIEKREKEIEQKFLIHRDINRTPIIAHLPWNVFKYFFFVSIGLIFIMIGMLIAGMWPVFLFILVIEISAFFLLKDLSVKHGDNFLDKMYSYYTMNTFKEITVNEFFSDEIIKRRQNESKS